MYAVQNSDSDGFPIPPPFLLRLVMQLTVHSHRLSPHTPPVPPTLPVHWSLWTYMSC